MAKKEAIIVVPGVKGLSKWPKPIVKACSFVFNVLNLNPVYEDHLLIWKEGLFPGERKLFWFHWNRNPDVLSKVIAVKNLCKLINSLKRNKVKLIGISLGGEIILEAISRCHPKNVKKAILICSINERRKVSEKGLKIVNIYSLRDDFAGAAIDALSFFNGSERLLGKNVLNINLSDMSHADFCTNKVIRKGKYKGQTPIDLVNMYLED